MDTRQKDKEKEKDLPLGERTPKGMLNQGFGRIRLGPWFQDQTWTVVKERHREDSSHGKMCGDWVIVDNRFVVNLNGNELDLETKDLKPESIRHKIGVKAVDQIGRKSRDRVLHVPRKRFPSSIISITSGGVLTGTPVTESV
ncbi:hypothetical protein DY000_02022666 [Brassica cretica]|uniref:Uncharacterized protein n=1 Tax=Brassica cretica TaxID=69181 RepID=A0ABQ7EA52_BRACR|nr:hypothetical protein DY000_02022666 [Brassica cretica]